MSLRLTSGSRVARLLAATGLLAAAAGAAAPQVAGAATVSTTLNYTCNFPLLRPQPLTLKITAEIPTTIPVNTPTGAFTIKASAEVNADAAGGLRTVSTASIEGSAIAESQITLPGGIELPLDVSTTVPKMTVPATGGFTTLANGSTPSIRLPKEGQAVITVSNVVLTLTPRLADGTLTGLDTFETECIQNAGQNNVLTTITVTPAGTTPAPVTPKPITPAPVTPKPITPAPITPAPTTPKPGGVKYSYGLSGSATLKTLTKGNLPLSGSADATLNVGTGDFSAALALNPAQGNLVALGFLPVTASVQIVPQGDATGQLNPNSGLLTVNTKVRIKIPKVTLFGLELGGGSGCQAKNISAITLKSPGEFDALSGGTIAGTFTISDLVNCGALTGIVSPLTSGTGNAIALKLTPKTA